MAFDRGTKQDGTLVNETTMTQCDMILAFMRETGSITQVQAAEEIGCWRLDARIWDLKSAGHTIGKETVCRKNRWGKTVKYAKYYLEEEQNHVGSVV